MNPSAIKSQKGFKLLQLSESGHGKTTRSVDAKRFGRVGIVDIDRKFGEFAKANSLADADFDVADVAGTLVSSYADLQKYLTQLEKNLNVETLVIDTLSELQDSIEQYHASLNKKTPLDFSFPDWRAVKDMNINLMHRLLSLPCNVIINAHLKKDKNVFDQVMLVPGLTGKAGEEILRKFNEVHFLRLQNGKPVVFGRPTPSCDSVKTLMKDKLDPATGSFKVGDLSVFDAVAFRKAKEGA